MGFVVLCAVPLQDGTNTVAALQVEARNERDAARIACREYRWHSTKVRRSGPPRSENGRYAFARYRADGHYLGGKAD